MSKQHVFLLACALFVGCKSGNQAQPLATHVPTPEPVHTSADNVAEQPQGFSWQRVLGLVGFQPPNAGGNSTSLPGKLTELNNAVSQIVATAGTLNINDPPQVTSQKAQTLLDSLAPWEGLLSTGQSMGLINDNTAEALGGLGGQLRTQAQKLIQTGADPDTIGSIQQLSGQLQAAYGGIASVISEGTTAYEAITGAARR